MMVTDLPADAVAGPQARNPRYARPEPLSAGIQMHQRPGPERLDDSYVGHARPLVGRAQPDVLRSHTEMDPPLVVLERHRDCPSAAVDHRAPAARAPPAALEDVHARVAEEPGDEHIGGPSVHLGGGTELAQTPPL